MNPKINPKIIINGYSRMTKLARKVLKKIKLPPNITVEITNLLLQNLFNPLNLKKESYKFGPQCILVSGDRSALFLKEKLNIPVIPIKVTGFDLMQALLEARQYDSEVVLANYFRKMTEIESCQDILKVKVHQFTYTTIEEAHELFNKLKKQKFKVVIGASLVCDLAQKYDMKGIFFYSQSALQEALEYAINMITSYQQETERAERLKTIVDFTHSGIISTDNNLQITTFNPAAEKILNIKAEEIIGRNLQDCFPEFQIINKGEKPTPKINSLSKDKSPKVVFSSIPIIVNGQTFGQVTVIQNTIDIQKAEEKIRLEMHKKRFVAQHSFSDIAGKSPALHNVIDKAKRYARTDSVILITGATGTGKELFAQSIHNISKRKNKPFIAVNCAALPESLLDSELFGYEQGAFTGARKGGKPGLFEMAHTGTIFLDEIGEISLNVQARLLRVLQEKEVMRIGGDRLIPVDVRVICATNQNLWELVRNNRFREDLYYRLSVLELHIPPLRERPEDIPELVRALLKRKAPHLNQINGDILVDAFNDLKNYDWPGNVRELENIIERFLALADNISPNINNYKQILKECFQSNTVKIPIHTQYKSGLEHKIKKIEGDEIQRVIKESEGNKTLAAQKLGISRSTLYRKLRSIKLYTTSS